MGARFKTHLSLLLVTAALVIGSVVMANSPELLVDRLSWLTAWQLMVLLTAVMLIGPLHVLRTGRVLTNHMLRRDLAIWAGLSGLLHVYFGLVQTMKPSYLIIYVKEAFLAPSPEMRDSLFFWGAMTGTAAGLILLVPLVLSNNVSLKLMGQRWWKRLHRSSYFLFALTAAHAFMFQVIERRHWLGYALMIIMITSVIWWQVMGVIAVRAKRHNADS